MCCKWDAGGMLGDVQDRCWCQISADHFIRDVHGGMSLPFCSFAGHSRKLRVTANPNITITRDHVPKWCQAARVVLLGPLTLHDLDAGSFLKRRGEAMHASCLAFLKVAPVFRLKALCTSTQVSHMAAMHSWHLNCSNSDLVILHEQASKQHLA